MKRSIQKLLFVISIALLLSISPTNMSQAYRLDSYSSVNQIDEPNEPTPEFNMQLNTVTEDPNESEPTPEFSMQFNTVTEDPNEPEPTPEIILK